MAHSVDPDTLATYVEGLTRQIAELKEIIAAGPSAPSGPVKSSDDDEKSKEIAELKEQNRKLAYRIEFLLRALDERDRQ